jgi:hypothetical protein
MMDWKAYSADAMFTPVKSWFNGNIVAAVSTSVPGAFDEKAAWKATSCSTNPVNFRQGPDNADFALTGFDAFVQTKILDPSTCTFGLSWKPSAVANNQAALPQYYRQDGQNRAAVNESELPASTQLASAAFRPASAGTAYTSPSTGDSAWTKPGPSSAPYTINLSDGSSVTYVWYRFIDQPALQHAGLTFTEKEMLQNRVELIHWSWPVDTEYMAAPSHGTLATLDSGLFVTPPPGLEVGFVPVVIRQEAAPATNNSLARNSRRR